jgi:hypothetical protein
VARVLHHDSRSLTPGGLLLGALSLGDCIISGFHHGGALALRNQERAKGVLVLSNFFKFLRRAIVIFPAGLWQASKYVPPNQLCTSVLARDS